jgi:hypothetical protein
MEGFLIPNLIILVITLFVASLLDLRYRLVPLYTWFPALIVVTICNYFYYRSLPLDLALPQFLVTVFFAGLGFAFVVLRFYGGADAIAIMLISLAFPVNPLSGHMQFITLHVFVIACAIVLVWSLLNLFKNVNAGHSGNKEQMIFGVPVPLDRLPDVKGWIWGMKDADGERLYADGVTERDMEALKDQKEVWVILAFPFMIPLFVALLLAVFLAA